MTREWSAALRPIRTSVLASSILDAVVAPIRGEAVVLVMSFTMVMVDRHFLQRLVKGYRGSLKALDIEVAL